MNLQNIGNNIKKLRLEKKLTQSQLAEMTNISTVHMSHIETGNVSMSLECLISLCNALKTTPDNILLGEYELSTDSTSKILRTIETTLTSDENRLLIEIANILEKLKVNRS